MTLTSGTRLGPSEIVDAIDAGGMGEVYRARDTRLNRTVAIKVMPASLAADPEFRERFEREARTLSRIEHPHICPLYDVGNENGVAREVLSVPMKSAPGTAPQAARVLFSGDYPFGPQVANYDVSPDGKRFLMMRGRQWPEGQVVVVTNSFADLRGKAR